MNKNEIKQVKIPPTVTVKRFAELLGLSVSQVMTELIKNKILATINEEIDYETAAIIAQDLGYIPEPDLEISEKDILTLEKLIDICQREKESGKNLQSRPPVVTILGHVDHGKTTLLDTIRKTNIVAREAGGITQHIRAYQVKKKGQWITFIDTPGHEAFSAMRERGVSIADIAVLVVAADDGVRPQTQEVIAYLKEKKIPTIVAINKIDKPEANIMKVKKELSENGILLEDWGGKIMSAEISAKNNIGIDDLLEKIILLSEIEEFKADTKRDGLAVVLEAHLDPYRGPLATVLVKTGTLKVGQDIVAGTSFGRIRKMEDYNGKNINEAFPSMPVTLIGLNSTPNTNDIVQTVSNKTTARLKSKKMSESAQKTRINGQEEKESLIKKLPIIIKADVQGSVEAIEQILNTIKNDEVALEYITSGVGNISESDIKLAESAKAEIFGFNVYVTPVAARLAEANGIKIHLFKIIYELVECIKNQLAELLPPEIVRTDLGSLKVLAIFKRGKHEMIVGGRVGNGKIIKGALVEVEREKNIIGKGKIINLQMNKENVEEVKQGNECGLVFSGEIKIQTGDKLIVYQEEEKRRSL